MVDWTKSMEQTFEYYEVDPVSWKDKKRIDNIKSSSISRDLDSDTLSSASIDVTDLVGECYIRIYLITIQNGLKEKHPLGTFLVQTPSSSFDGKVRSVSMDAYSPLLELKENAPPLGYSLLKNENIMEDAYNIIVDNCRCPVVKTSNESVLTGNFVSNTNDKWITFIKDLIVQAKYELDLDEMGTIMFRPIQAISALQPRYTFDDGNSSILYPEINLKHDIYGIPNVVEVICSSYSTVIYSKVENNDINSPTSIQSRGRRIIHRISDPDIQGIPTQKQLDEYAERMLKELSSVEYTVTFSHGYYPVRIGDCVRLNYKKAGIINVKAKIISQSISCTKGCKINTTAVFTKNLWK